ALTLRPRAGAPHADLDFVGLRVDSVRIDGERVAFTQNPGLVRVAPEAGFEPNAVEVEFFYRGRPHDGLFIGPDPAGVLTAFADNWPNRARWWFPANDHPPDKATVEFRVRPPAGYQVVANGRLLDTRDGVWRWRTDVEIPAYTMVVGVAPFERAELGAAACGRAPEATAGGAPADSACVSVSAWALSGGGAYAEERFSRAPDMVDFYTEMFAPYPYEKLAHVQSSTRFGGMENSSAIFYAMDSWAEREMGESVIAHETVHQWFGDSVTPEAWSHLWVSEGFATYFAAVYFGERDGPEAFRRAMENGRQAIVGSEASDRPVIDERSDLFGLLNTNSYPKGAWILHMLRSMLGDEAFYRAIRDYYAQHAGGSAGTDEVRRAMEAASGEELGWFFDQWAHSPGFPRLDVSTRASNGATLVTIEQVQPPDWPTFRLPLVIVVERPGGRTTRHELWMEGRREILRIAGAFGRDDVTIDPDGTLLLGKVEPAEE
ncbi:MAG: M1 family metallopeptidase, partial [Gemmatimonadota bacterium]